MQSDNNSGTICTPPKILNAAGDACVDPTPVCVAPQILNATKDACVDPVPVCVAPQTLVNNVCVDPVSVSSGNPQQEDNIGTGTTTTIDTDTTLVAGEYNYDNLVITNNAILILGGDPTLPNFKGVKINAVNITIDPGSHISADAQGYGNNQGLGVSTDPYTGASYGGLSYNTTVLNAYSKTYGSALKPTDLGSGGNSSAGGAIYLNVSDTFTDNGIVSADGNPSSSGGSIYVTAKNIAGNGILRADGGGLYANGYFKSPGGGGRVAVYYQNSSFNGTAEAKGGCGVYGAPYVACGGDGTAGFFDTTNNNLYVNGSWNFLASDAPFSFNNIYISNGANVTSENGVTVTTNNLSLDKTSSFILADNQVLNIPTIAINGGSTLTLSGTEKINANNLSLNGTNSEITITPQKILSLNIPNISVGDGSSINADSKGLSAGPGSPTTIYDPNNGGPYMAGASYGGLGYNASANSIYGSETAPVDFGSGGNVSYTHGGGAIRIISTGNFINNGTISASGDNVASGGSIYLTANSFSGAGTFRANGGGQNCPYTCYGPGGGGRIAIYYQTSSFTGVTTASGMSGNGISSGDGTVKIINTSLSSAKQITAFSFAGLMPSVAGAIDENSHTVSLTVPFGTNVTALVPTIAISDGASISPNNNAAQNFSGSVTYTVTAQDTSTQNYKVTVTVLPDPNIATKLKIITPAQTIGANSASGIVTVESQNNSGAKTDVVSTTYVNLSSSSATGSFSSASATDNSCDTDWAKTKITISTKKAHESFCYKDSAPGTPTITVSANGLTSDSQIFTVN